MLPGLAGIPGFVGGSKAFSYQELKTDGDSLSAYTFAAANLGTAEVGRVIIVSITANGNAAKTISSVTIGGVSASILVQQSNGFWAGGIAAAVVPTGTTGDIVVNLSNTAGAATVGVYRATGLASVTPIDTDSNTTFSGLTLTAEGGGFLIALTTHSGSGGTITWANANEDFDTTVADSANRLSGASIATTSTSITVTPTAAGTPSSQVFVAATF
jgi:hypothetical protein